MTEAIAGRALAGAAWLAALGWVRLGASLTALFITAAVLGPETLGTFAALWLVIATAQIPIAGGFTESLVQRDRLEDDAIDATAWLVVGVGVLLAVVVTAGAETFAAWVALPDHAPTLRILAWLLPLEAAAAVPLALLARRLAFKPRAAVLAAAVIAGAVVSVVGALAGWGLTALVAGAWAKTAVQCAAAFGAARWRPGPFRGLAPVGALMRFNLGVQLTYVVGHVDVLLPRYLIAVWFGPSALGIYNLARRIEAEVSGFAISPLVGVAMPACSRLQHDPARLRQFVLTLYRVAAVCVTPLLLGAAVLAPAMFAAVLGPAWIAAIPIAQIVLVGGLRAATTAFNTALLQGAGRPGLPVWLFATGLVSQVLFLFLLAPLGALGAGLAYLARGLVVWPIGLVLIRAIFGLPVRSQLATLGRPLVAGLMMAAAVASAMWALPSTGAMGGGIGGLVFGVVLGGAVYGAAVWALFQDARPVMSEMFRLLGAGRLAEVRLRIRTLLQGL